MSLHDLEIVLDEDKPVTEQRVLKATVDVTWSHFESNPGGREVAHYSGSEDGQHVEDWSILSVEVDGVSFDPIPKDLYSLIEEKVLHLKPLALR